MSDDLIARLRTITSSGCNPYSACHEAADELVRLSAEVERLTDERYRLAYAICGGEDFPGLLDGTSVEALVKIAREAAGLHMETIDRAMRAEAALSDERAHADAMEGALTALIEGGNRQLALISRKVKVTDPMTLTVTKGQLLAAIEAKAAHRARRQG